MPSQMEVPGSWWGTPAQVTSKPLSGGIMDEAGCRLSNLGMLTDKRSARSDSGVLFSEWGLTKGAPQDVRTGSDRKILKVFQLYYEVPRLSLLSVPRDAT